MSTSRLGLPPMDEILELARLLRQNGDQVLNGTSKLSLSKTLLFDLNSAFSMIVDDSKDLESSFQVCNSSEIEFFRDLKFLHDFVQKTIWLKVTHGPNDSQIGADITKFRHLRYLELQKVCIERVTGIQGVRGQLESISCTGGGGVGSIGRLLAACGGDAGVGFVWGSLKRLALAYNGLGRLDKSLELAPWLQTLDLSHNYISSAVEIDCLPNLKHVNLGYNKLETVPRFNRAAYRTLQKLVLKNNYIDDLSGLQGLDCLAELDLSWNCLSDHAALWPLETMTTLVCVNFEGNPLAHHKNHRVLTLRHLNASLAEGKFVLDKEPLTKNEKIILSENRRFGIRSARTPIRDDLTDSLAASGTSESNTAIQNDLMNSQKSSESSTEKSSYRTKKRQNVSEAIIDDDDEAAKVDKPEVLSSSFQTSMEHLETKKKILELRERVGGDHWLSSDAGGIIQEIMGIESTPDPLYSSTPLDDVPLKIAESDNSEKSESNQNAEKTLENEAEDETEIAPVTIEEKTIEPPYDPEEETGQLFLVQKKRDYDEELEEVFLVVTPEDIKERDSITGRIKTRWSTQTILSCVMGRGECPTIDFIFDTTRRDRQGRTYFVDPEDAGKIVEMVSELIKARPILLKVFKCMRCSTHFSQDSDYYLSVTSVSGIATMKPPMCPSCKSTLVIQTDELSDTDNARGLSEPKVDQKVANKVEVSEASRRGSLRRSMSQSSIGSATSLEGSRESTPSASTMTKKYESDIEILSNPSQSSIEVLDDGTRSISTPSRKRSSEERRIAVAPTLLTIPDTTPIMAGLTESSSSGSLTDSICTAYENKNLQVSIRSGNIKNTRSISESENTINGATADSISNPVSNLTSMLGGLLQSMKIGTNKGSPEKSEEGPDFSTGEIRYSYTDFKSLDHRIKLHLILNVFEQENEELVLFLRAEILLRNQPISFPGCLVLSTSKMYILRITGAEGEDPQRWLHKEVAWTTDRLRTFAPLPFKQGVLIELQLPSSFADEANLTLICILQDFQRTSNLLFYLTELSLPTSCEVEFAIPEQCTQAIHSLMASSKYKREADTVRILALFSSARLELDNHKSKLRNGGLVVTTSSLILTVDKVHWLLPDSNETPMKLTEQGISNLLEVTFNGSSLGLSFLDEVAGQEEVWTLNFVSEGAAEAVINAIQPPWEELFSVPLQITTSSSEQPHSVEQKS